MHIFLIRHGESIANVGQNYEKRIPDHLVSLTEKGKEQARENGEWLANYCKARIWRSPFLRTRQTSEEFNKFLGISDIREDVTLTEQQFGLFDSIPEDFGENYIRENTRNSSVRYATKENFMQDSRSEKVHLTLQSESINLWERYTAILKSMAWTRSSSLPTEPHSAHSFCAGFIIRRNGIRKKEIPKIVGSVKLTEIGIWDISISCNIMKGSLS